MHVLTVIFTTPFGLILAVPLGFLAYGTWWARREARKDMLCRQCGQRFNRVAYYPSRMANVGIPHYYCPNDHTFIGNTSMPGESLTEHLGGWAP